MVVMTGVTLNWIFSPTGIPDSLRCGIDIHAIGVLVIDQHIKRVGLLLGIAGDHDAGTCSLPSHRQGNPRYSSSLLWAREGSGRLLDHHYGVLAVLIPGILQIDRDIAFISNVEILRVERQCCDLDIGFDRYRDRHGLVDRLIHIRERIGPVLVGGVEIRVVQRYRQVVCTRRGILVDGDVERCRYTELPARSTTSCGSDLTGEEHRRPRDLQLSCFGSIGKIPRIDYRRLDDLELVGPAILNGDRHIEIVPGENSFVPDMCADKFRVPAMYRLPESSARDGIPAGSRTLRQDIYIDILRITRYVNFLSIRGYILIFFVQNFSRWFRSCGSSVLIQTF